MEDKRLECELDRILARIQERRSQKFTQLREKMDAAIQQVEDAVIRAEQKNR